MLPKRRSRSGAASQSSSRKGAAAKAQQRGLKRNGGEASNHSRQERGNRKGVTATVKPRGATRKGAVVKAHPRMALPATAVVNKEQQQRRSREVQLRRARP